MEEPSSWLASEYVPLKNMYTANPLVKQLE